MSQSNYIVSILLESSESLVSCEAPYKAKLPCCLSPPSCPGAGRTSWVCERPGGEGAARGARRSEPMLEDDYRQRNKSKKRTSSSAKIISRKIIGSAHLLLLFGWRTERGEEIRQTAGGSAVYLVFDLQLDWHQSQGEQRQVGVQEYDTRAKWNEVNNG